MSTRHLTATKSSAQSNVCPITKRPKRLRASTPHSILRPTDSRIHRESKMSGSTTWLNLRNEEVRRRKRVQWPSPIPSRSRGPVTWPRPGAWPRPRTALSRMLNLPKMSSKSIINLKHSTHDPNLSVWPRSSVARAQGFGSGSTDRTQKTTSGRWSTVANFTKSDFVNRRGECSSLLSGSPSMLPPGRSTWQRHWTEHDLLRNPVLKPNPMLRLRTTFKRVKSWKRSTEKILTSFAVLLLELLTVWDQ